MDGSAPAEFRQAVDRIARSGGTPLAVTQNGVLVGVIHLKDVVKPGVKARFADLRRITAHGARKRQHAYIAKQLRGEEDDTLDAIRERVDEIAVLLRQQRASS